jgi:DNA-nicking Smr family endonuclease
VTGVAEGVSQRVVDSLGSGRELPRRQIDLHGMSAVAARSALTRFVVEAGRANARSVLIVCGKGLHSGAAGPVLPDLVVEHLSESLALHVLAFCTAPRRFGGRGALLVRLRAGGRPRWP